MLNLTKNKLLLSLGTIALSLFLFSFLAFPTSAATADAEVTLDLAPILGISATDIAIEISPNVEKSYDFTTGVSTVTVSTNNITGYTLSIEGKDGSTVLHNSESNTDIASITDANISSTSFSPNSWGYTLSSGSSATYNPIPAVTSEIKRTMSTVQSDETPVQFGVSVLPTIASGRYQGTVTFTALANFVPETEGKNIISIDPTTLTPNGGDIVATTDIDYSEAMGTITGLISNGTNTINCVNSAEDSSTTLSFSETANNKLQVTCHIPETDKIGENYALTLNLTKFNETYTSDAVIKIAPNTIWGITTMQAMTPEICANTTTPNANAPIANIDTDGSHAGDKTYIPQTTLTDTRGDGAGNAQTYVIRKLADGNCWMVQNLNLNLSTTTTLTSDDTDLGYGINSVSGVKSGRTSWTPNYNTFTNTGVTWSNLADVSYSRNNGNIWFTNGSSSTTTKPSDETQAGTRHIGNYYNWYAAIAGEQPNSYFNAANQTAGDSICPKGWQLPYGTQADKSFYRLTSTTYGYSSNDSNNSATAGNTTLLSGPFQAVRAGYYNYSNGSVNNQGVFGDVWSSTTSSNTNAYHLYFHGSNLKPQDSNNRGYGFTVRCVAR